MLRASLRHIPQNQDAPVGRSVLCPWLLLSFGCAGMGCRYLVVAMVWGVPTFSILSQAIAYALDAREQCRTRDQPGGPLPEEVRGTCEVACVPLSTLSTCPGTCVAGAGL